MELKKKRNLIAVMAFLCLILLSLFVTAKATAAMAEAPDVQNNQLNVTAYASGSDVKTVKVGYYAGDSVLQDGFSENAVKSGYAYEYMQEIANSVGWIYTYDYGDEGSPLTKEQALQKLRDGTVDIVAGIEKKSATSDLLFSYKDMEIPERELYFAVKNAALLVDLNNAIQNINNYTPDFLYNLQIKYYSTAVEQFLSSYEKDWLIHKDTLKVGYINDNLPISDENNKSGKPEGLVADIMELMLEYFEQEIGEDVNFDIKIEGVCYNTAPSLRQALIDGEIDVAFPIYSYYWLSEYYGFKQTDSFINDRIMMVYRGTYSEDMLNNVASSPRAVGQKEYLWQYYPNTTATYYDTIGDALSAVKSGKEQIFMGTSCAVQRYLNGSTAYSDLNVGFLPESAKFSMGVKENNIVLLGILNKFIRKLPEAEITRALTKYSAVDIPHTFADVLAENMVLVITVLLLFIGVLATAFILYGRQTVKFNRAQTKNRLALEEAIKVAEKANEAKTTFLSSMSHDIRTPMNAIVGMTTIANRHIDDKDRVKDCLNKIPLSSNHLLTLINDILDISKIESGKLTLSPVTFSLRDTVTNLVNVIRPMISEKNMQFDVHVRGVEYEYVYADTVRVNQVFINILSNAVKYTPEGGKIVMDLCQEVLEPGKKVRLKYVVQDNGIGMSKEFMANMYSVFARAEDSRINKIQGTGLGLAIVKQMVTLMNGTIDCESELNKGTKFTITLDLDVSKKEIKAPTLPDIKMLIVDDDAIFLESMVDTVTEMGAKVDTAPDGETAIKMVTQKHADEYSVIIVDWKMPGLSGLETVKKIRNIVGKKTSIILISAYDWEDVEEKAKESGVDGFISKPLFRSYIYEKICAMLNIGKNSSKAETTENASLNGLNILVAEDNDLNWEIISVLLDMYGVSVTRAKDGRECVDIISKAKDNEYNLILMDVQMPVLNGRDATREIRKSEREYVKNIPVIAMTADAFAEDVAACLDAGMNDHVAKPVDMNKLCQVISKILKMPPPGALKSNEDTSKTTQQ